MTYYKRPNNAEQYKRKLWSIIQEHQDYWLKSEKSKELYWEYIDRFEFRLGSLKQALCRAIIPSMDTILKRRREINVELEKERKQKELTSEEILRESLGCR